jgi:N4-gp56 family major capsid protein
VKEELGVTPGRTMQILKYAAMTGSAALTEGTNVETQALDASTVSITVAEKGKAIALSELLLNTSFDDLMTSTTRLLGMDYAKTLDGDVRDTLLGATSTLYANGRAGRASLSASDKFNVALIRSAATQLATNKAPKYETLGGGAPAYLCFVHPAQAASLRADPEWRSATQFGDPSRSFNGEIGRIEDVIFIYTTQVPYVDTSGNVYEDGADSGDDEETYNTSVNVYRAVMCGDYSVGWASALPVELRTNGIEDFQRKHSLMWYAIYGTGLLEDNHVVILETAA